MATGKKKKLTKKDKELLASLPRNLRKKLGPEFKTWKYPDYVPNLTKDERDQLHIMKNKRPGAI